MSEVKALEPYHYAVIFQSGSFPMEFVTDDIIDAYDCVCALEDSTTFLIDRADVMESLVMMRVGEMRSRFYGWGSIVRRAGEV